MNKTLKITLAITLSVLLLFSCFSMALYYFLPVIEKNVTYGLSEDKNGNPYIEVEYWSNKENNGVELLDIRLHGYATIDDFEKNDPVTYYKGVQFVGDSYGSISFSYIQKQMQGGPFVADTIYNCYYVPNVNCYYYDYQNGVGFKSIKNLDSEYRFKVSLGSQDDSQLYFMKLSGVPENRTQIASFLWYKSYNDDVINLNYLSKSLLYSIRANNKGMDAEGSITMDVGLMFDFMEYSTNASNQHWVSVSDADENSKIKTHIQEFALVNYKVHSDGAKFASDSMFGIIANSSDFEYTNPNFIDNYLIGRQVVNLTEKNFTISNGKLDFTSITKSFLRENESVNLIIEIDLDILHSQGISFTGFSDNVKTYNNRIISIFTKSHTTGISEVVL